MAGKMTLGDMAKELNRSTVYLSGLQRRFELPIFEGTAYTHAYLALLRKIVFLRTLYVAEDALSDLWKIEKHLVQLLHRDATGSPTWFLDEGLQTGHLERRLLLTHHDLGPEFEHQMLQPHLDFSKQRALFSHKETGDDVIHVLERYLDLCAKIRAEAEAEAPLLRAALRWFPKALSEKQEMKSHGMG